MLGGTPVSGYTTEVSSKEPTPTSIMISQVANLRTTFID